MTTVLRIQVQRQVLLMEMRKMSLVSSFIDRLNTPVFPGNAKLQETFYLLLHQNSLCHKRSITSIIRYYDNNST